MNVSSLSRLCFVALTSTNSYSMWNISFDMDKYHIYNLFQSWILPFGMSRSILWLSVEDYYHYIYYVFDGEHLIDTRQEISTICLRHIAMWHIEENPSDYPSRTSTTMYSMRNISSDIRRGINTRILLCLRFGNISFDIRRVNKYHKGTSRNICTTLRREQVPLRHLIRHSLWSSIIHTNFGMSS